MRDATKIVGAPTVSQHQGSRNRLRRLAYVEELLVPEEHAKVINRVKFLEHQMY